MNFGQGTSMHVTNSSRSIGEENTRFIRLQDTLIQLSEARRLSMTITAARASEGKDT